VLKVLEDVGFIILGHKYYYLLVYLSAVQAIFHIVFGLVFGFNFILVAQYYFFDRSFILLTCFHIRAMIAMAKRREDPFS